MAKQKKPTKKKRFPVRKKRRSNNFWDVWNEAGDSMDAVGADAQWLV